MFDGFDLGRALARPCARLQPILDRTSVTPGGAVMMRQQFRLGGDNLGKRPLKRLGDALVKILPALAQQCFVSRLLHQGLLEAVDRLRRLAQGVDQARGLERAEIGAQQRRLHLGHRLD